MTGSLSRTATAYGGGTKHRIRGSEARLAARVRGKEAAGKVLVRGTQTAYEAGTAMGKGAKWSEARRSSGRHVCKCGGQMERRSHVLPREICLFVRPWGGKPWTNKGSREVTDGQAEVSRIRKPSANDGVGGTG